MAVLTEWLSRVSCCLELQLWFCCPLCSWLQGVTWLLSVIYWGAKSRLVLQCYTKASVSSLLRRQLVMDWALYESSCSVSDAVMSISEESCVWQVLWCVVLLLWVEQMMLLACPQEQANVVQKSPITVKTKTECRMGKRKHRSIGSRARLWIIHSSYASCRFHPLRLFRMLSVGDADKSAFKAMGTRPCRLWSPACPSLNWLGLVVTSLRT